MKYFFYSFLYREISMTILCMGGFCGGISPRIAPLGAIAFGRMVG